MMHRIHRNGFTLIELLIVVAIIAILAAIAVPNFLEAQMRSKVTRIKADMRSLAVALESYSVDNNVYVPCATDWLAGLSSDAQKDWRFLLTTPVSHITSWPKDVFTTYEGPGKGVGASFSYYTSWYYRRIGGWVDPAPWDWVHYNAAVYRSQIVWDDWATGETAAVQGTSVAWALESNGPDRVWGDGALPDPLYAATPYDATNGSISLGEVSRYGP